MTLTKGAFSVFIFNNTRNIYLKFVSLKNTPP